MVERARLESEYTGNRIGGSNPPLSANYRVHPFSRGLRATGSDRSFPFGLYILLARAQLNDVHLVHVPGRVYIYQG